MRTKLPFTYSFGLFVLVDERDVRPAAEAARIDQRRRHIEVTTFVDADAIRAYRDARAHVSVGVP